MLMIVTPIHVKIMESVSMALTVTSVNVQEDLLESTVRKVGNIFCQREQYFLNLEAFLIALITLFVFRNLGM